MFRRQRQHDKGSKKKPDNHAADGAATRLPEDRHIETKPEYLDAEQVGYEILEDPEFPDTEGIGYETFPDGSVIGYVESVNGKEAEGCFGFEATRHELKVLAKYWYRELTDIDLLWLFNQTAGSTEWRTAKYATRRIARIRTMIGDLVDEVVAPNSHGETCARILSTSSSVKRRCVASLSVFFSYWPMADFH